MGVWFEGGAGAEGIFYREVAVERESESWETREVME